MSRKRDISEMASLVGNSAAHVALYPSQEFVEKEVVAYVTIASEVAAERAWNDLEINEFRAKAVRRAKSEIKRRVEEEGLDQKTFDEFMVTVEKYIEEFVNGEMRRKGAK